MPEWLTQLWKRLNPFGPRDPLVAVVRLHGPIGIQQTPFAQNLTLAGLASTLSRAFSMGGVTAVALVINSPGGAAAQSALIHKRIRALAKEKHLKVFAFCEDVAASGGYMLACAADEIFADDSSIVGSIGVISGGFGFDKLIEKIGVDRRIYATGDSKDMLDPFRPERPEDIAHLKSLQQRVYDAFVAMVKERRGTKLKGDEKELFSGAFWSGVQAKEMGLIDGLGDVRSVLRATYGENVRLRVVNADRMWWRRSAPLSGEAPAGGLPGFGWAQGLIAALETRALWGRYGL